MSEETRTVLEMLKEGKITTGDAERLLEKLRDASEEPGLGEKAAKVDSANPERKPRYLRIQIDRPGAKEVNVRMPLSFVRNSQQLLNFLPRSVAERLQEKGIFVGVSGLHGLVNEDFVETLKELNVDIDQEDGQKVKIFCE